MFRLESVTVTDTTKELAERINGLLAVPGERNVTPSRIAHLEREIEAGTITTFRWAIAKVAGLPGLYRVNGQHTSRIFANGRKPVGKVVLETYVCDTIEDLVSLWSRFDAQISSRSQANIRNTVFKADDDLKNLPIKASSIATRAAAIYVHGYGRINKISQHERASSALVHKDFVIWACSIFSDKSPCARVGVFLAALHCFIKDRDLATKFWLEVQDGSNPDPNSGSRALQILLLTYSGNTGKGLSTGKKTLAWDQAAELCLSAWNSWIEGRPVRQLKVSKTGLSRFLELPG